MNKCLWKKQRGAAMGDSLGCRARGVAASWPWLKRDHCLSSTQPAVWWQMLCLHGKEGLPRPPQNLLGASVAHEAALCPQVSSCHLLQVTIFSCCKPAGRQSCCWEAGDVPFLSKIKLISRLSLLFLHVFIFLVFKRKAMAFRSLRCHLGLCH